MLYDTARVSDDAMMMIHECPSQFTVTIVNEVLSLTNNLKSRSLTRFIRSFQMHLTIFLGGGILIVWLRAPEKRVRGP